MLAAGSLVDMGALALVAANGLALGLASTLHCAGMCGAISCSLMLAHEGGRSPCVSFAMTHAGRILAYTAAGAVVGSLGASAIVWLDRDAAFRLLQWGGAAALIWVGLSTAGLLPSVAYFDRALSGVADAVARSSSGRNRRPSSPLLSGFAWGMMPCAMVYAALFTAMLSGSTLGGAAVMVAFGLGTLPGLVAASVGLRSVAAAARTGARRVIAGLAIALFGASTVLISHPAAAYLCLP